MLKKSLPVFALGLLLSLTAFGQAVFVGSGDGATNTIFTFRSDSFIGPMLVTGGSNAFAAIAVGPKYYVLSKSQTSAVTVLDSTLNNVVKRFDYGLAPTTGVASPDGRRVIVLSNQLHMYDTAGDVETSVSGDFGYAPTDVAFTQDARRALVLNATTQKLSVLDMTTNSLVGTPLTVAGSATAVSVGPNGLVYVSGLGGIVEYVFDPISNAFTSRTQYATVGIAGKLSFSPDGVRAVAPNVGPTLGSTGAVFVLDLTNRIVAGQIPSFGPTITKVLVTDNAHFLGLSSTSQKLYQFSLTNLATFGEFQTQDHGVYGAVRDCAISNESPQARYLYLTTGVYVYRVDLVTNTLTGQANVTTSMAGEIAFAAPPVIGAYASNLLAYNTLQTVAPGAVSLPLSVRATDYAGHPISGITMVFSTPQGGAVLRDSYVSVNNEGFATTVVTAPATSGSFTVNARIDGQPGNIAVFTISVSGDGSGGGNGGGGGGGGATGLQIYKGQGQLVAENSLSSPDDPMTVRLTDATGAPVPNVLVTWTVSDPISPPAGSVDNTSTTDANGLATARFVAYPIAGSSVQNRYVRVTVSAQAAGQAVNFSVLILPVPTGSLYPSLDTALQQPLDRVVSVNSGGVATGAVRYQVSSNGVALPGVGLRFFLPSDPVSAPSSYCVGGIPLSDANGIVTCDVRGILAAGTYIAKAYIGSVREADFTLKVAQGDPSAWRNLQGDGQTGLPGQKLPIPLSAQLVDAAGNTMPGVAVTWQIVTPGSLTLANLSTSTETNGNVSGYATLGSTPGAYQVTLKAGNVTISYTLTVKATIGGVAYVSGDNQIAVVNQQFAQPLVIKVTDQQGRPLANIDVAFAVVGGAATLASPAAKTDNNGQASSALTAGATSGPIAVTATVTGQTPVRFGNLTARLPGPILNANQIVNAAGFTKGVAPGALVTIYGAGIAPALKGSVVANTMGFGPLPTRLNEVEVQFGPVLAPILSVSNINGQESVTVQVPFELAAPSTVSLTVRVSGGSTTLDNVPVQKFSPGIFEMTDLQGRRYAIVAKSDGSFATPENPAVLGEKLTIFCTGLGQLTPLAATNRVAMPDQVVAAPLVVGVNNQGNNGDFVATLSSSMVGVYEITFVLGTDTAPGLSRALSVSVADTNGDRVFSNSSSIAGIQ